MIATTRWVDVNVQPGYGLVISGLFMVYACSNDVVLPFMQENLGYTKTFPSVAPHENHELP